MNVYDTANKLAKELNESSEYTNYKNIKIEIANHPDLKEKLKEFENLRYQVQLEGLKGENQERTKLEEMQKLYAELIQNDIAKRYFDYELKFNVLLADVNKIIAEAVKDVLQ